MKRELDADQERYLLELARRTIENFFRPEVPILPERKDAIFKEKRGAFVTLKKHGELRGCIGYPLPYKTLTGTIMEMAVAAAVQDYRFEPVTEREIASLVIEISVLTPPVPVADFREVEVGRHGIIVSQGSKKGLLLPQVPTEYGWNRETFLRHGCLKAGLPEDAWKKGARIEVFEAQVFSEKE